ncbi:hypothetical protein PMZ80_005888 [Knufia obscura]|uniref:Uncharacterized protein n=2 Tax=Knufia TaxID=430999 RepID=A0AAN8EVA3_9EURO|nr:hypothetical protein PMZ80_005888 [Knufia obscura]KAK5954556.1 hypothetical protein OHC33_004278 [Knufia fluminis]
MAPAKKDPDSAAAEGIRALCVLMASSAEFNPDYNVVATALGIAQAKNVPRKIDSIIRAHGYIIKSKKIVKLNDDGSTPDVPATPKAKAPKTPATSDAEEEKPAAKSPTKKTPAAKKEKSPTKKAATPRAKKRKIEEVKPEEVKSEDDEDGGDDEATKMIKEKMGDGTDDEEGDEVREEDQV